MKHLAPWLLAGLTLSGCSDTDPPRGEPGEDGGGGGPGADLGGDRGGFVDPPDLGEPELYEPIDREAFPALVLARADEITIGGSGFLSALVPLLLQPSISRGDLLIVMELLDLADVAVLDGELRVGFARGGDGDGDPADNFSGAEDLCYPAGELDAESEPRAQLDSTLEDGHLEGSADSLSLPLGLADVTLTDVTLAGDLAPNAALDGALRLSSGVVRGGLPAAALGGFDLGDFGGSGTILDLLACGGTVPVINTEVPPTQPDRDLDGDGCAETIQCDEAGVIVSCDVCGDAPILGADCWMHADFGDGYEVALTFAAVQARIAGICR